MIHLTGFFYFYHSNKKLIMGRGDKKTKRGKIAQGSYGVSRPKRKKVEAAAPAKKKTKAKKAK